MLLRIPGIKEDGKSSGTGEETITPYSIVFLSKNISSIKQKVLMFQTNETSVLYIFYLFGKTIPEKFYSEKLPSGITKAPGAGS